MKHYLSRFQDAVVQNWDRLALCNYGGKEYTFGDVAKTIEQYHIIFEELGIKKKDKVAICMPNSAQWANVFLAIGSYGAVMVPILYDFTPESVTHLVEHSEAKFLFIDKKKWDLMDSSHFTHLNMAISVEPEVLYTKTITEQPAEFMERVAKKFAERHPNGFGPNDVHYTTDNLDELAIINYTSGTTSDPKGVMLTNRNISSNIDFGLENIPNGPGDTVLSMLPLAHMFGMAFEFIYPIAGGCTIYFLGKTPTPQILMKGLADVKPYLVLTVPLVVEKIFKNAVIPTISKQPVKFLMSNPITRGLVAKKIREKLLAFFGGNMRVLILGGAALNQDIEKIMQQIKMPYTVGYGMTECAPLIGYHEWKTFKKGSCGTIVDRMEIKIDSANPEKISGEILVKGDNVMMGYYKNEEATKATFTEDGQWLRTGDMGTIDKDGNIFIKGRCKSMILTDSGQNIYPEEIEDKINNLNYVVESIVVERNKQLVALVVPDRKKAEEDGLDEQALIQLMEENRAAVNLQTPAYSKVVKFELMDEPFQKTPKMSIKRFLYK